ncbi:hypothetical protein LUZ63_019627 [Rhynchospora breviuscula]|uniref:Protein kinase domain-containing protein n=1 Tax=Rhynchospora breviuscula TaxID=2022672 RepID=A0A9Q0C6P6_9POAL|nr:hypothetical protein LUZ63_019627 [Rhynchospora breviuscula]
MDGPAAVQYSHEMRDVMGAASSNTEYTNGRGKGSNAQTFEHQDQVANRGSYSTHMAHSSVRSIEGFLSIDCGLPANSLFVDSDTGLTYVSDEIFVDTGIISNISSSYVSNSLFKEFLTVRYFPAGTRNCYTLRSLTVGSKYLIRATFYYGNYDNANNLPTFDIYLGINFWYTVNTSSPSYPEIIVMAAADYLEVCFTNYNVSMVATSSSTLPPLLNAIELYTVAPLWGPTDAGDVAAINRIKVYYKIKKGWSGDPCLPTQFLWTGVACSTNSNITRITGLDIRGNSKISTFLPPGLQRKQQDGSLKFGDISLSPSASAKKNVIIAIAVVVSLLIMAIAIATIFGLKRKKYNQSIVAKPNENYESGPDHARNYVNISQAEIPKGELESEGVSNFENRKFRYKDLKRITNGFKNKIGTGGFGSVYLGLLENEFQVAVKIRSQSSKQGVKEFMAEAENLARVHHKNLVSLVGYCIDKSFMALVYEYMPEGNLHDKIKGLEHLHMACNPPLIHRDVKTSNILLSANLEAKLSDFGLSRIFSSDISHISTRVVGTPGYVAPEYYSSNHVSAKSDVYSFGVVLLEIITGRPPIVAGLEEEGNLVQWVDKNLSRGDIKSIADPRMEDISDVNSVLKVIDLACMCTQHTSTKRPTMNSVVAVLKECLDLEMAMEEMHIESTNNLVTDVSQELD